MKQCKTLPFMFLRSMFVLFLSCLSVNTLGQSLTVSGTVTDEKWVSGFSWLVSFLLSV